MAIRSFSWILSGQVLKLAISLAIQVLVARVLLPEGRGVYGICIAISTILIAITHLGNEFGIRYLLVTRRITASQAFYYLLCTASSSLALSVFFAYFLFGFILVPLDGVSFCKVAMACFFSFGYLLSSQINVYMSLLGDYIFASVVAVCEELLRLAFVVALFLLYPSVESAFGGIILGTVSMILFCVARQNFYRIDGGGIRFADFRFIYLYGVKSAWLNFSNLSNAHMGTLVLSGVLSSSQIGIYNLSFGLVARLQVLPDSLNRVLVASAMTIKDEESRFKKLQVAVTGLVAFSLFVIPVFAIWNQSVMVALFGVEYSSAGEIAFILLVGFVFKVCGKPLEAHFNEITGKPRIVGSIQIFNIVVMCLLSYLGAISFGVTGAAIGSAIALFIGFASLLWVYRLTSRRSLWNLVSPSALVATVLKGRAV